MQCLESIHTCKYFILVLLKPALETLLDVRTYILYYVCTICFYISGSPLHLYAQSQVGVACYYLKL